MLTRQEIFNKVYTHLNLQGKRSSNEDGECLYRGPNNTMCAAGCLIPDGLYYLQIESMKFDHLGTEFTSQCGISPEDVKFVRLLQTVHDFCAVESWIWQLQAIADSFNLIRPQWIYK